MRASSVGKWGDGVRDMACCLRVGIQTSGWSELYAEDVGLREGVTGASWDGMAVNEIECLSMLQ